MDVKQIATLINTVNGELMGDTAVMAEDLSNVVDIGTAVFGSNKIDNYVKALVDHIGRMVFVDRKYAGGAPSVLMDGWEFGAVLQKVRVEMPKAVENDSWDLTDGMSYDPNKFTAPKVGCKFYQQRVTFQIEMSFTDRQVKSAFSNAQQLNAFVSMIYTAIENSMTVKLDSLIQRTINNMIGETVYAEYQEGDQTAKSTVKAVNLLKLYNTKYAIEAPLTADKAITDAGFLKFAAYMMGLYETRIKRMSKLFNIGAKERFTPSDRLHFILLSEFESAASVYLQSDTFHDNLVALPGAESVPYWQGSGTDYALSSTSKIDITTSSGHAITVSGVLGVMFDRDALGVTNMNRRVTTDWNAAAEFTNNWFKMDAGYFNDTDENFVVFFAA